MKIQIQNHQRASRVNPPRLRQWLRRILPFAQQLEPIPWETIVLHLVDDAGIRAAHQACFGTATVTDVISQHYPPLPGESGCQGEIIVNVEQALRARHRPDWSPNQELALYIAHGIDHLHGSTDTNPRECQRMRRRELRWIRQTRSRDDLPLNLLS